MTCHHCTSTVEKAVSALDHVLSVDVSLEAGTATAYYDTTAISPADTVAVAALATSVADAAEMVGFDAAVVGAGTALDQVSCSGVDARVRTRSRASHAAAHL